MYPKKYQHDPAHCGIVFVSRIYFLPLISSSNQSFAFTNGLCPSPDGLKFCKLGKRIGKFSSKVISKFSSNKTGNGSPQYL